MSYLMLFSSFDAFDFVETFLRFSFFTLVALLVESPSSVMTCSLSLKVLFFVSFVGESTSSLFSYFNPSANTSSISMLGSVSERIMYNLETIFQRILL